MHNVYFTLGLSLYPKVLEVGRRVMAMSEVLPHSRGRSAPASAPTILRLDPTDLAEVLERLADPMALTAGLVNVISLEGVVARFGPRWSFRRELVHELAERVLHRHLGDEAVFQRIGEAHYVVMQSGRSRVQAQSLCLRCLREILHHFIGEVRLPDMRLHEVTHVSANEIVGHKVDVPPTALVEEATLANAGEPAEGRSLAGGRSFNAPLPPDASRSPAPPPRRAPLSAAQWTPFVASNGRTMRVSCSLEPVIKLSNSSLIGFRLARRVLDSDGPLSSQALRSLSRADIARVDFATIARGIDRLRAEAGDQKHPSLIVPVSFTTLSNQRTREAFVGLLEAARAEVRLGLVCEICELDGVPPGSLLTAVSLISPFCVRVLAFLSDPRPAALRALKGLGLGGISLDCPGGLGDGEFVVWAREMARAARTVGGAMMLYRVQPRERGALAALAGVSHVSLLAAAPSPARD